MQREGFWYCRVQGFRVQGPGVWGNGVGVSENRES